MRNTSHRGRADFSKRIFLFFASANRHGLLLLEPSVSGWYHTRALVWNGSVLHASFIFQKVGDSFLGLYHFSACLGVYTRHWRRSGKCQPVDLLRRIFISAGGAFKTRLYFVYGFLAGFPHLICEKRIIRKNIDAVCNYYVGHKRVFNSPTQREHPRSYCGYRSYHVFPGRNTFVAQLCFSRNRAQRIHRSALLGFLSDGPPSRVFRSFPRPARQRISTNSSAHWDWLWRLVWRWPRHEFPEIRQATRTYWRFYLRHIRGRNRFPGKHASYIAFCPLRLARVSHCTAHERPIQQPDCRRHWCLDFFASWGTHRIQYRSTPAHGYSIAICKLWRLCASNRVARRGNFA